MSRGVPQPDTPSWTFPPSRAQKSDVALRSSRPTGRAEVPFFGGRLMPSAGIPLRPSFVRSIHARIARPRPFTRVQYRRSGRRTPMKLPRRQFLHLAAGAAALPAVSRIAWAQAYPTRPVRIIVGFAAGGGDRHRRAPDRSMAVGAARPAIHHREPAGRRRQYRHRGGRARARRRLHAAPGQFAERDQRDALRQAQFQFHPRHRAGRGHHPRAQRHGGESIGSGQDRSRVHRLCQGQSGQNQHGVGRHRDARAMSPASCSR